MTEEFQILITTRNNIEWLPVVLKSLENTLQLKNRQIIIYDSSQDSIYAQLEHLNAYGLNIKIIRDSTPCPFGDPLANHSISLARAVENTSGKFVCLLDVDVAMLYQNWDAEINKLLDEGKTLISNSIRFLKYAELSLLVAERDLLIQSGFKSAATIEWDEKILHKPAFQHEPTISLTYLHAKRGEEKLLLTEAIHVFSSRFGPITTYNDKEFLYHNFYSQRDRNVNTGWAKIRNPIICNAQYNAYILLMYVSLVWPDNTLAEFLGRKWPSFT